MTEQKLISTWLEAAKDERADNWCNTADAPIWKSIHKERAAVFELCAAQLSAVLRVRSPQGATPAETTLCNCDKGEHCYCKFSDDGHALCCQCGAMKITARDPVGAVEPVTIPETQVVLKSQKELAEIIVKLNTENSALKAQLDFAERTRPVNDYILALIIERDALKQEREDWILIADGIKHDPRCENHFMGSKENGPCHRCLVQYFRLCAESAEARLQQQTAGLQKMRRALNEYWRIAGCSPQALWSGCVAATYSNIDHFDGHREARCKQLEILDDIVAALLVRDPAPTAQEEQ